MVSEIRLYVEGGGDGKDTKAAVRRGFHDFRQALVLLARAKSIQWQIVACGSRQAAFHDFLTALDTHRNAFNVLLVDAEGPVYDRPKAHLEKRDGWQLPDVDDEHYHLMVQTVEAWLVADVDAVSKFYGQGFNANTIPKNPNVEQISKEDLESTLKRATRNTSKGKYHKIKHGPKLLGQRE